MNEEDLNIIESTDMPDNKYIMVSQEYIDAMSIHYTEPKIEDPESLSNVDIARAVMALASNYLISFKTVCEAFGIDYDQFEEDRINREIDAMQDIRVENNEEPSVNYNSIINEVDNNDSLEFESFCVINNTNHDIALLDLVNEEGMNFHIPSGSQEINFKAGLWSNMVISDSMIINSKDLWREISNDGLILTKVSTRTKLSMVENKKPKKKARTTIDEDMMNFLLK